MNLNLQRLVNQLPGAVLVLNSRYQLSYVNAFLCQQLELPEAQLLGQDFFSLFPEVPKSWFCRKMAEVLQQQQTQQLSWQQRLYLLKLPRQVKAEQSEFQMAQNVSFIPLSHPQEEAQLALWLEDASEAARYHAEVLFKTQQLKQLDRFDTLTALPNWQYLQQQLQLELTRAERYQRPLALLRFELDRFKLLNDQYGHQHGDQMLQGLARQFSALLRDNDLLARLAGAEFAVILPDTELAGAIEVAQRLRQQMEQFCAVQSAAVKLTISCGISTGTAGCSVETMLQQADQALYQAKRAGRNQISIWSEAALA